MSLAWKIEDELSSVDIVADGDALELCPDGNPSHMVATDRGVIKIAVKCYDPHDMEYLGSSSVYIEFDTGSVALRYLLNAGLTLEQSKTVGRVISAYLEKEFSLTYAGRPVYVFKCGKEV